MDKFEYKSAVTGMGMSDIGRRLMRDPMALTIDASLAAMEDAGLTRDDIDGVCTYPGAMTGAGGISGAGAWDVIDALRLKPNWHNGGLEQAGQLGSVVAAMMAVATGMCRHVLCFRTVWEATHTHLQRTGQIRHSGGGGRMTGGMEWRIPFGAASAANWIALYCSRYMHEYGLTKEQLGQIPLNGRKNAAITPYAVYKDPLSMADYLDARVVSTPFGLYDCDVPCDASVAFIISHKDTVKDCRRGRAVGFEAVGTANTERVSWDQADIRYEPGLEGAAKMLWSRTDLRPKDIDMAQLYDGFSFNALCWLERLGFCGEGEAGDFLEGGHRIARDGELPLNTNGGQLSAGRLHGYGFLHEACVQLLGEAGERQVPNNPQTAVATSGGGVPGSAIILTAP
jgi:acetyl-CoA acetyltransferase